MRESTEGASAALSADEAPAVPPTLGAGAVARRLGVAVTTLRTWDRRYGLGASRVSPGGHRRYTAEDVTRLERMCLLVSEGVPSADAAREAVRAPGPETANGRMEPARVDRRPPAPDPDTGRAGLGLARAAMRLDADTVTAILERAFASRGVVRGWEDLARPILYGLGRKWERAAGSSAENRYVEVEHLLTHCVSTALRRYRTPPPEPAYRERGVLLACTEEELHSLPLEALSVALAERGLPVRMFGAALPHPALLRAVRRTAPAAVVLWAQVPATAALAVPRALRQFTTTQVYLAGPGWTRTHLPVSPTRLATLPDAVAALAAHR